MCFRASLDILEKRNVYCLPRVKGSKVQQSTVLATLSWLPHKSQYKKLCRPVKYTNSIFYLLGLLIK
jgi:hypothetical protein